MSSVCPSDRPGPADLECRSSLDNLDLGGESLLVLAASSFDPDIASFLGGARVGDCLLAVRSGSPPVLGFLNPMEREEAASTRLKLVDPKALEIVRLVRQGASEPEILRHAIERCLHHAGIEPGVVRLAGSRQNGVVYESLRALESDGWAFASGSELVRRLRKTKNES